MKPTIIIGIILIVLGVAGLVVQGVSYTTREDVADIGGLHVTAEKQKTVPIPAILGAVTLAGGIAVIVVASKKST